MFLNHWGKHDDRLEKEQIYSDQIYLTQMP